MMYNNSVSWNMGILQKLIDFANETSIHCLSFVVQTSASKLKRLTWAFLFVASLYYASFQLKQAFQCKFFWLTFKPAFPTNSHSIGLAIQGSVVWSPAPGTWKSCQSGWKFMDLHSKILKPSFRWPSIYSGHWATMSAVVRLVHVCFPLATFVKEILSRSTQTKKSNRVIEL